MYNNKIIIAIFTYHDGDIFMTLQDESRLSFYRELTVLDSKKNIILVQNIETKDLYVKKILNIYSTHIYEQLKNTHIKGVPDIIECIKDNNSLIVIEEYIHGRNLKQVIELQGTLNEQTVYSIAVKLAEILITLHNLTPAIIHRDIKPSNIILDKNGHLYLIDYNAARHVSEDKNEDTKMLGTMYFAAPEQYGFGQSDERTDIYGLGATINYLLTGNKPGDGIANCNYSDIIKKCLMLDPSNRYQSANELLDALTSLKHPSYSSDYHNMSNDSFDTNDNSNQNTSKSHTDNNNNNNNNSSSNNNNNNDNKDNNKQNNNAKNNIDIVNTILSSISEQYKKYLTRNNSINTTWKRYLPPGFRMFNPVFCIFATIWYLLIIVMSISINVTENGGIPITGYPLAMNRLAIFLIFTLETLWFGNYLDIRRKLPGMKKINILSFLLMFIYGAAIMIIIVILLALCIS